MVDSNPSWLKSVKWSIATDLVICSLSKSGYTPYILERESRHFLNLF